MNQNYHEIKMLSKLQQEIETKKHILSNLHEEQKRINVRLLATKKKLKQVKTKPTTKKKNPKRHFDPIFSVGERNSGTNMLYNALRECYGNKNVHSKFARDKHWLQDEYVFKSEKNVDKRILNIYKSKKYTVFVAVRNVYNWVAAMNARPYEMPAHTINEVRNNMTRFILHPWTMKRPRNDNKKTNCQGNFPTSKHVIPCIDFRGIYELNSFQNGEPYKNILAFRAAKLRNYLNMSTWNPKVVFVKLENYYKDPKKVLKTIEEAVGAECANKKSFDIDFKKTKVRAMKKRIDRLFTHVSKKLSNGNYNISKYHIDLIKSLTDWKLEKAIG
eukprot:g240.t1